MILIEKANETNDDTMPDKNILAILYEEISKDPREALRITALNCKEQSVPMEEVLHSQLLLQPTHQIRSHLQI